MTSPTAPPYAVVIEDNALVGLLSQQEAPALVIPSGCGYEIATTLPPQAIFLQKPWTLNEVDAAVRPAGIELEAELATGRQ